MFLLYTNTILRYRRGWIDQAGSVVTIDECSVRHRSQELYHRQRMVAKKELVSRKTFRERFSNRVIMTNNF